ncbi:hypothetical protein SELMODRAFT_124866 [Selaginella moellendorffii]|uniref:HD domain-containing protein n=1 Tax=Selaginella moellendorffii TaxID=88036 RepID=D8STV3_SELML|nr:hypothetical protein SELMODRAFT_124866 [Selaginella moellendorffii]
MALGDNGGSAAPPAPSSVIHFLTLCQRLKTTKRAGWLNRDVKNAESIADHMHRMAIMALIAADIPGIDKDRCVFLLLRLLPVLTTLTMSLVPAIVGDITPADGIPKDEKSRRERAAIDEMCDILENGRAGTEIRELWNEYESNLSPEAKLVKDLDKVEMILQALEYESAQDKELDDFFMSTAGKFQTDIGKAWAAEIVSRREKRKEKLHAAST